MTTLTARPAQPADPLAARDRTVLVGAMTVLGTGTLNQVGAAIGALAFPVLGPSGVVAFRQLVAGAVLMPIARPDLRAMRRAQWVPVVVLAAVMGTMNLALYAAVERIGLGLAVTLEFLGPLAVALVGSRRPRDVVIALTAIGGVYLLVDPGPATDVVGVLLALTAAACWAAYILINRELAGHFRGIEGPALASGLAGLLYLPVLVHTLVTVDVTLAAVAAGVCTGLLASVVPYAADVFVLRRVPTPTFGVLMSVHPALASFAGLVVLRQTLAPGQVLGMLVVITANVLAVRASRPATPHALPEPEPSHRVLLAADLQPEARGR